MGPSGIAVAQAVTRRDVKAFIELPFELYRRDPNWVAPLLSEMWGTLTGPGNPLLSAGEHRLLLARRDGKVVGRLLVGVNRALNQAKTAADGYLSLFEAADYPVAEALFGSAEAWLAGLGLAAMKGPVSPTNGDDYRGLLVDAFDRPPVLMDSYNPASYPGYFDGYGFVKDQDLFAYRYEAESFPERYRRVVGYAMERYGFRVDPIDLAHLEHEVRDIKAVIDQAMPADWADLTPPTLDELRALAAKLKPIADPELVNIARAGDEPVGFGIALPDYNEVLGRMRGRLLPFGWYHFLRGRGRIRGLRFFVLFVVPEYRRKGVTGGIFLRTFEAGVRRGMTHGEGSTIGETNLPMRRDAEGAGGIHYKTYRIYRKTFGPAQAAEAQTPGGQDA